MKISEMIKNLQEFMDEHGDLDCFYAIDDEGNGYGKVHYEPSLYYTAEWFDTLYTDEDLGWMETDPDDCTAVCVIN